MVQTGILVERLSPDRLCDRVTSLLASAPFKVYAAVTCIEGLEDALLHAYLLHALAIFNPTEGNSLPRAMIDRLFPRGKPAAELAAD